MCLHVVLLFGAEVGVQYIMMGPFYSFISQYYCLQLEQQKYCCISVDPYFCDAAAAAYHLMTSSRWYDSRSLTLIRELWLQSSERVIYCEGRNHSK